MNSDVEGTYYFRGLSLGDYNGVGFDDASSYESGTVSPLEYSTRNIKDEYPKATVSVKLADNLNFSVCDFVPNFTESFANIILLIIMQIPPEILILNEYWNNMRLYALL